MGEKWDKKYPVVYSLDGDTIDSAWQKYISEIERLYNLLDRVRSNDETTGEPDDTVPWQWHVDHAKKILYLRNPGDTAWLPVCALNTAGDRFVFDQMVANNGGCPSVQYGLIAARPAEEVDGAIFVATDEKKRYRWNGTTKAWDYFDTLITRREDGKIHVDEAAHAAEADHATAATNAGYAETVGTAEYAVSAGKLKTAVNINGIPFDGSQSIHIEAGGSGGEASYEALLWRTEQNEREISNIELAIEDNNIFPDYNNLLVENFQSTVDVDQTQVLVTSSAAGDDSLNVGSLSGIKVGALYMLTDGVQHEYVTVKGIAKQGATNRVVCVGKIVNVYNDNTAWLYRTTATVGSGKAAGGAIVSMNKWNPSTVWSGEGSSKSVTVELNTNTNNAAAYASDTSVLYTSDGLVSMIPATVTGIALIASGGGAGTWENYEGAQS